MTLPHLVGRSVQFVDLQIPSNGRFSQADLRLLWEAGAELTSWQKARIALARDDGTFGAPEVTGTAREVRDWRSLAACAHDAANLLARWPSIVDRQQTWQPIGIVGGVEDLLITERFAEPRGYVLQQGATAVVTQSARWSGARRPLTSVTITTLTTAILQLVRSSVPSDELRLLRPLLDPIATVSRFATAPGGSRDPDPSSWPVAFIAFAASCMRVLADLQSQQRGRGVVPFLDTDELYEAWLATETRRVIDLRFGGWVAPMTGALAAWDHHDTRYELWVKPTITRDGTPIGTTTFIALVADKLTPDLLLTATRGDKTEFAVLDAKSWALMLPEDALAQSAKYLYGIRRKDEPDHIPALAGVDLITCAAAPSIGKTDVAKIHVLSATPTTGTDVLATRLGAIVDQLTAALIERERRASEF